MADWGTPSTAVTSTLNVEILALAVNPLLPLNQGEPRLSGIPSAAWSSSCKWPDSRAPDRRRKNTFPRWHADSSWGK